MGMGRKIKLRDVIGIMKDKASLSKASILLSDPTTFNILRATTHDPSTPPTEHHISTLLSFGHGSRATSSAVIHALMRRLHHTRDSSVAIKSLLLLHVILTRGSFILQDQLSVFPTLGGRNYLNLSNFRDHSSPATWILSGWVRWYANYLEHVLSTSRVLGFFLSSISNRLERETVLERVSELRHVDLMREVDSLVSLVQEICKVPESFLLEGNRLVYEVMELVGSDYVLLIHEASVRIGEFKERLTLLSFGDSVELVCVLKRLEDCKERVMAMFEGRSADVKFWGVVSEVRGIIGMPAGKGCEQGRLVLVQRRRGTLSESASFADRVLRSGDSIRCLSGRLCIDKFEIPVLEPVEYMDSLI